MTVLSYRPRLHPSIVVTQQFACVPIKFITAPYLNCDAIQCMLHRGQLCQHRLRGAHEVQTIAGAAATGRCRLATIVICQAVLQPARKVQQLAGGSAPGAPHRLRRRRVGRLQQQC